LIWFSRGVAQQIAVKARMVEKSRTDRDMAICVDTRDNGLQALLV
jgi:hypothetical protein